MPRGRLSRHHMTEDADAGPPSSEEVILSGKFAEKRWMSSESCSESAEASRPQSRSDSDKGSSNPESPRIIPNEKDEAIEAEEEEEEEEEHPADIVEVLPETTAQTLLQLPQQSSVEMWSLLVKKLPVQRSVEDWEKMKTLTFIPSHNFKLSDLDEERTVCGREDEGLFIGTPLPVASKNLNRLKERIFRESGTGSSWFSGVGTLQPLLNPYRQYPLQLINRIDPVIKGLVVFRPAQVKHIQRLRHRQLDPGHLYEMTLEVGGVQFLHHPLFSKEHVLAKELKSAFTEYATRLEKNWSERCEQKLRAMRNALHHTKDVKPTSSQSDEGRNLQMEKRLAKHRREIENLRNERDESFRLDKMTLRNVLDKWKQIKRLREEQHYVSTSVQLKIISFETVKAREKELWDAEVEEEFQDLKDTAQGNFDRQMRVYRRKLRKWSAGEKGPAEKPYEGENGGSTGSEDTSTTKPTPPSPFQENKVREEIRRRFTKLKRLPGEPKVILEMGTTPITPTNELPSTASAEARRRKAFESTKIHFLLRFNMKTDYHSEKENLNSEFMVLYNISVKIPIQEWPECLHFEIYENGNRLHSIELRIPDSVVSFERSKQEKKIFTTPSPDKQIKTRHAGVGSGVKFTILSEEYEGFPIMGELTSRIGWSADTQGNLLCPNGFSHLQISPDEENPINPTIQIVDQWTQQYSQIDPNNPENAQFLDKVSLPLPNIGSDDDFAPHLDHDKFCDWSDIQNSNRLRLLFLRDQEVPEFKNIRMIPASEAEIVPDIFHEYENRLEAERAKESGDIWKEDKEEDRLEDEWDRLQPIRTMRMRLLESFESSVKQITFEDLVVEEQIPDIGTLGLNLMSLFQPRRPLRPIRKERKRIQTTHLMHTEIQLVVNIVRAINLPLRKDSHAHTLNTESVTGVSLAKKGSGGIWIQGVVKPFVEVWFQRRVSRSTTALGPDPTWNQELQLPLIIENEDYSESILSRLEEEVYLQVYDEVAIDLLEDERRRNTDIHQRLEKRWLGCISIPFATLYRSGRIEGTFRLNCPPILLGYESKESSEGLGEAYLTLFITLQPTITPPPVIQDACSGTGESSEMLEHVKAWTKEIQKVGRVVKPFVLTPNGDTVLASRYLVPIKPPEGIFHEDVSLLEKMEALAHYVSLFPSLRDASSGVSQYALWFTPDVFVNTPGGGREDHSVLLASFFLYLGVSTYIIQGESIPDGPTTQLLTSFKKIEDSIKFKASLLWNACTGRHTRVNHTLSSLHKAWTAIGQYNMWGNVSGRERPDELDWEFEKSKDWLPLFPKGIAEFKLPRLQIGTITFSEVDEHDGNRLGQRIERKLKETFMKWRHSRTTWNRYSSTKLRCLLPLLEERRADGSPSLVHDEHLGELREIMKSYDMTGFPLHQPFSTLDSVMESVYSTGLHTIDTPDVQFALGAYAKAYPAAIFSLWVYIAALHPVN